MRIEMCFSNICVCVDDVRKNALAYSALSVRHIVQAVTFDLAFWGSFQSLKKRVGILSLLVPEGFES